MNKPSSLDLENMTENEKFLYHVGLLSFMKWKTTKMLLLVSVLANIALCVGWWSGH